MLLTNNLVTLNCFNRHVHLFDNKINYISTFKSEMVSGYRQMQLWMFSMMRYARHSLKYRMVSHWFSIIFILHHMQCWYSCHFLFRHKCFLFYLIHQALFKYQKYSFVCADTKINYEILVYIVFIMSITL